MKNPDKPNHYLPLRNAVFATFGWDLVVAAFYAFLSECCVIGFTTYMIVLIKYLKDPDAEVYMGIIHILAFAAMMIASVAFKNEMQMLGFRNSVAIRKSLTAAIYSKIAKLSMRSLTETNSGKLITIVSGDLQMVT